VHGTKKGRAPLLRQSVRRIYSDLQLGECPTFYSTPAARNAILIFPDKVASAATPFPQASPSSIVNRPSALQKS